MTKRGRLARGKPKKTFPFEGVLAMLPRDPVGTQPGTFIMKTKLSLFVTVLTAALFVGGCASTSTDSAIQLAKEYHFKSPDGTPSEYSEKFHPIEDSIFSAEGGGGGFGSWKGVAYSDENHVVVIKRHTNGYFQVEFLVKGEDGGLTGRSGTINKDLELGGIGGRDTLYPKK